MDRPLARYFGGTSKAAQLRKTTPRRSAPPPGPQIGAKTQTTPSECVSEGSTCASSVVQKVIAEYAAEPAATEAQILSDPSFRQFAETKGVPTQRIAAELAVRFKPEGPRNTRQLLSNFDIDAVLGRWATTNPQFYNYEFCMIDFAATGGSLARVSAQAVLRGQASQRLGEAGIVRRPCTTFACVLNTDVSSGRGKHWVAIFGDCRGTPRRLEYFNSTGNPPPKEVTRWMETTALSLEADGEGEVVTDIVTNVRHQTSQSECGLYALYYIRCRLKGVPSSEFRGRRIPDERMSEFRTHVFR